VLEQQQQEEEEAGREEREGESARVGEGHGAVMEPLMSVTEFLEQCKVSGDSAYNAVKVVLERLRNPETRVSARVLLAAVEKHVAQEEEKEKEKERESSGVAADSMTKYHFRIHQLSLTDYEGIPVDLLCVIVAAVHAALLFCVVFLNPFHTTPLHNQVLLSISSYIWSCGILRFFSEGIVMVSIGSSDRLSIASWTLSCLRGMNN
jgi:hypothetical protein